MVTEKSYFDKNSTTVTRNRWANNLGIGRENSVGHVITTNHIDTVEFVGLDNDGRTVSEWSKDNTVSFGLRDIIRRFRGCLGR